MSSTEVLLGEVQRSAPVSLLPSVAPALGPRPSVLTAALLFSVRRGARRARGARREQQEEKKEVSPRPMETSVTTSARRPGAVRSYTQVNKYKNSLNASILKFG